MPTVVEARQEAKRARAGAGKISACQTRERTALHQRVLGNRRPSVLAARIERLRKQTVQDRGYLARLDQLPPQAAPQLVRERAEHAEAQLLAAEEARGAAQARATQIDALLHERGQAAPHTVTGCRWGADADGATSDADTEQDQTGRNRQRRGSADRV